MKVSDLAKELNVSSDDILSKLRALKLKAKDSQQDLSEFVLAVLRRELAGARPGKGKATPKAADKTTKVSARGVEKPKTKTSVKEKTKPVKAVKDKGVKKSKTTKATTSAPAKIKPAPVAMIPSKPGVSVSKPAMQPTVIKPAVAPQPPVKPFISQPPIAKYPGRFEFKRRDHKPAVAQVKEDAMKPIGHVEIPIPISIKDLSVRLQVKPSMILKKLMEKGMLSTINQIIGEETVRHLSAAMDFTYSQPKTQEEQLVEDHAGTKEDDKLLTPRPPVVTFMGHVDHGKTSLLDRIRKAKVADSEHGGITQHIGAYSVKIPKGRITFLDTPGHEAFTAMRARGAHITDIVVLVVAADEGIMPQTEEAIDHARAAKVPIIVALNKIDKKGADIDRVKKELQNHDLTPEDWGGKTIVVGVSAATGEGVDNLLEMILLESELLELKANFDRKASGIVVEAQLSRGKGPIATVIVQNGTLREGDVMVVGPHYGRIKAMFDDHELPVREAFPATPVEILGLSGVPRAGEVFYSVEDEKKAREIVQTRKDKIKNIKFQPTPKVTLEDLYSQIKEGKIKELNIIIKADVQGSLEALKDSLSKIPSDEVSLKLIHTGIGEINTSDVLLAEASNAIIIGFNIDANSRVKQEIEARQVELRTYRIIYDAIKEIRNALEGLLEPKTKKKFVGRVEIRKVLNLTKAGIIAGCFVAKGKINRKVNVDVVRNGEVVFTGTVGSLKRFKDDVREVAEGFECGLSVNGFNAIQVGDLVECFELEKIARTL